MSDHATPAEPDDEPLTPDATPSAKSEGAPAPTSGAAPAAKPTAKPGATPARKPVPAPGESEGVSPTRIAIWVVVSAVGLYLIGSGVWGIITAG